MSGYTPGPWDRCWTHTSDSDGHHETGRIVGAGGKTICNLAMGAGADANARLIAAAPLLLAALEGLSEPHCILCGSKPHVAGCCIADAIAKATMP